MDMDGQRVDFASLDSQRDALDRIAGGTSVEGIPDAEIAHLWVSAESLGLAVRLKVHRGGWRIVPARPQRVT